MLNLLALLDSDLIKGIANGAQLLDLGLNLNQTKDVQIFQQLLQNIIREMSTIQKQNEEIIQLCNSVISCLNNQDKEVKLCGQKINRIKSN